jgi:hypothetical protein
MAAGLCYGSRGGGAAVAFHHQVGAYNTDTLIGALGELRRLLGGQRAKLLWDGLPAHRSKLMHAWLRRQRSWLVVEPLPAYAPELNPVERCGPASRGWSWPTWPARAWRRSLRRPSVASIASATPTTYRSRSCATAACPMVSQRPRQITAGKWSMKITIYGWNTRPGGLAAPASRHHRRIHPAPQPQLGRTSSSAQENTTG